MMRLEVNRISFFGFGAEIGIKPGFGMALFSVG